MPLECCRKSVDIAVYYLVSQFGPYPTLPDALIAIWGTLSDKQVEIYVPIAEDQFIII